jgi:hypothetical protein
MDKRSKVISIKDHLKKKTEEHKKNFRNKIALKIKKERK